MDHKMQRKITESSRHRHPKTDAVECAELAEVPGDAVFLSTSWS
jgi:hypothetical protein